MMGKTSFLLASAVIYTAAWWLAVLYGKQSLLWLSLLLVAHFVLSPSRLRDFQLMPLALVGMTMDTLLMYAGVLHFAATPVWLMLLWLHFVLALEHSLAWLGRLPLWAQVFAGVSGGAGSYLAGAELGAVSLPLGNLVSFLLLSCLWGALIPGYFLLRRRIAGNEELPWPKN